MLKWKNWILTVMLGVAMMPVGAAKSDQFPSRTISIVTPVAPGVPFDLLGRLFAERLRQKLGVSAVIENVTGGNGLIATQRILSSKPDGYSLLLASTGLTTAPFIMNNAGYAPSDFVAIAPLGQVPYVLLVSSAVPANDIESLLAYIKTHAKSVNFGVLMTSGTGALMPRKLGSIARVELTEVGYRGSTAMITALLANEIQIMATTYSVAGPHLEAGKIKVIGVLGDERIRQLPNLPTFKEKGYPSLTGSIWAGLFARAGTPTEVLSKLSSVAHEIVTDQSYLKAMESTGMEPWSISFDRSQMAWRAAQDIADGSLVNLGLGLPVTVADYLPAGRDVFFQAENGVIGVGPLARSEAADGDLVDASSRPITLRPGAAIVDSSWAFSMIRGGHIDVTILSAFEVASCGDLAN